MFGKKEEMLPVWPYLKHSPILKLFGWSSLAHHAFEANRALFSPAAVIPPQDPHPGCPTCVDRYAPLDGLLAVHLRRGDFATHCPNLCHWGANFNAFNRFPEFVDPWDAPQGDEDARMAVYMQRCLPTVEQIVAKIEEVRASGAGRGLRNIYLMTNGEKEWLEELKAALWKAYRWQRIATSRDTVLTDEQKYVAQSMDMLVGERAQVYIGNGVSHSKSIVCILQLLIHRLVLQLVLQHRHAPDVERAERREHQDVVARVQSEAHQDPDTPTSKIQTHLQTTATTRLEKPCFYRARVTVT